VPEPLDDRDGVETLRFVEGAGGGEGWYHQHTDQGLASAARLLRRIHDAGRGWTPPVDGAVEQEAAEIAWVREHRDLIVRARSEEGEA